MPHPLLHDEPAAQDMLRPGFDLIPAARLPKLQEKWIVLPCNNRKGLPVSIESIAAAPASSSQRGLAE